MKKSYHSIVVPIVEAMIALRSWISCSDFERGAEAATDMENLPAGRPSDTPTAMSDDRTCGASCKFHFDNFHLRNEQWMLPTMNEHRGSCRGAPQAQAYKIILSQDL